MCGIAGIVNINVTEPIELEELQRMAACLAHRGPDACGTYLDPQSRCCGLAHRRLSIIDLEGGRQPLANEDETIWISYNGECYNFPQLRRQLQHAGHKFRTHCDTEVVVHLYQEYGPECVEHMRGMFALAIWDQTQRQLFLARDRMGQKPLYYALYKGRFIFASECKAILHTRKFPRRPDLMALGQYLLLQYVPYPHSGFADIRQLPPAHTLTITAGSDNHPQPRRYWSIPTAPVFKGTESEAVEHLRAELAEATRIRMISDVPLGSFLSGGIDSTIIVGLMSQAQSQSVKTCAIGFAEQNYNELPYASIAAKFFHTNHFEKVVRADCLDTIEKLSYFYDEPFADCSALPTYHLSHLARSQVTVALTGDGGDECFGGYDRYRALYLAERINRICLLRWLARRRFWQKLSSGEYRSRIRSWKRFITAASLPVSQRYLKWMAVFNPDMLEKLCLDDLTATTQWDYLARHFPPVDTFGSEPERHIAQAMLSDGNNYLPNDLNTKIDRASMSIGLELRCPFQDHKVVELAYSLKPSWRHNGKDSKRILRRAFFEFLPKTINRRRKMGFGVPVGRWFRTELRPLFMDTVLSSRALQRGYFHRRTIETLLAENDLEKEDHGHRLWSLLMLELWHRRFVDDIPTI